VFAGESKYPIYYEPLLQIQKSYKKLVSRVEDEQTLETNFL
jgi:hypothetical protein